MLSPSKANLKHNTSPSPPPPHTHTHTNKYFSKIPLRLLNVNYIVPYINSQLQGELLDLLDMEEDGHGDPYWAKTGCNTQHHGYCTGSV